MITGEVSADREAIVTLIVSGPTGAETNVEAVVDTGFTDSFTLPISVITELELPFLRNTRVFLADGSGVWCNVYQGQVDWNGAWRTVPIHEAETDPLIGMRLMQGYQLFMDIVDGGSVTIGPRS